MTENGLAAIEDASLNASAPPQQLWLDGWLVRFCPGKAKRSRSVNAVAAGRLALADRLARTAAVYREAGLPMVVRITPFSQPAELDSELGARGWMRFDDSIVMVAAELPVAAGAPPAGCVMRRVDHAEFVSAVGALRQSPADQRAGHMQRLGASPVPYQGWLLEREHDGALLACGQIAREATLVGLYDIFTAPPARGQGLAQALCRALLQRAAADGARTGYLQVDAKNAPAIAAYRKLGFVDGYHYHYRAVDPATV